MAKPSTSTSIPAWLKDEPTTHPTPPSSSRDGFFQPPPKLQNSFHEDEAYKRVFSFYIPPPLQTDLTPDLSRFGDLVLAPTTLAQTASAELHPPYLRAFDTWGRPSNTLVTSEGWRKLQDLGIREGIVAIAYENQYGAYSRLYQFLKYHLWAPSSAGVTCPSGMTDGAARLLATQLARVDIQLDETERKVFEAAYTHLTSRDPKESWTSGQWMTERQGGSDVRNTETQATFSPSFAQGASTLDADGLPLGAWSVSGFKWFSSATDSQMTILLAKTPSGALSAYFAPMRRRIPSPPFPHATGTAGLEPDSQTETELNGITIQRLKSKLGTRPVPTAELVLSDTRAYLLGAPGQGVKIISTLLNITRIHNSIQAMGSWGRGLAISRAFTLVRKVRGRLLVDVPGHMRTLAGESVEFRGMLHLAFFCVALLGVTETTALSTQGSATSAAVAAEQLCVDTDSAPYLLRLLTPISKALTARAAIAGLAECMESLGGVGYLENEDPEFNIARLYRDANVLSIWEGTTNVMADDVVRVLKGRNGGQVVEAVKAWLDKTVGAWESMEEWRAQAAVVRIVWEEIVEKVRRSSADELKVRGRDLVGGIGWIVGAVLLGEDARRYGDEVAGEVAKRWVARRGVEGGLEEDEGRDWRVDASWDRRIVFGDGEGVGRERARL
ncbi:hypothetical protein K432DRAFT_378069 [Lepidopterella palustris CBS 459.81]|uniref:Acyl-CoA dehydrogenase/oxidase C-terminal n=1 Tax=Lepidopterella palustris CBS 459.81 TaxID=1314670 RepID=A0A8E2EK75_9PEZI|nr:hypothetical protein K432DRAFT_378069 [Lepidopterella palustris CBS 459.81]